MKSRRNFLKQMSGAALAVSAAPSSRYRLGNRRPERIHRVPGEDGMIVRSFRFVDLETPVEYFNTWLTPVPHFFVRNHMHEPSELNADELADWRLTVGGEVEKPFTLTLSELSKLETHSVVNTLECAGNGRSLHRPQVPGIQWGKGAVSTARFSGPRLRDVLQRAGVKPTGKHVMFRGLDEVPGKVPPFIRSIPIEKALDSDTLVATHMNGAPLTKHHGFPARALVPGWIGAASCKWLTEIKILESEFVGNFMSPGYRFPNQPGETGRRGEAGRYSPADGIEREVGDLWTARWRQPEGRQSRGPWSGVGRRGRHRARSRSRPMAARVGIPPASATTRLTTPGASGAMSGRPEAATTPSCPAPPTPRDALSPPLRYGIPAAICTTPSIR